MSENSASADNAWSPFNNAGEAPTQVAYQWGLSAKSYKGANVDITYGVKSSTTIGLSNTNVVGIGYLANYTPLYFANTVGLYHALIAGFRRTMILGSDSQYISGNQTKTLKGTEIKHNGANKYEFFDTNAYKFIGGKEYKVEAKSNNAVAASGTPVPMPELQPGKGICTFVPYQDDYHTQFKNYSEQSAWVAKQSIKHISDGTLDLGSSGKMTTTVGTVGPADAVTTSTGKITQTATGDMALSGKKVSIVSTAGATLMAGASGVQVALNKVSIGLQVELGVPNGPAVNLNVTLSNLAADLAAAMAAAQTAQAAAQLAAQGAVTALNALEVAGL